MQALSGYPVILKLSEKDIERANEVLAFSLIRKLFEKGKISEKVYLNIQKEIGIIV